MIITLTLPGYLPQVASENGHLNAVKLLFDLYKADGDNLTIHGNATSPHLVYTASIMSDLYLLRLIKISIFIYW